SAFMLEAHFCKATPGCDIAPLNNAIHPMQVIDGQCQGGEMGDDPGSYPLVPIVWVTDDDPDFAASMGGIHMEKRTVADERVISIHREDCMLGSGKILCRPLLDI